MIVSKYFSHCGQKNSTLYKISHGISLANCLSFKFFDVLGAYVILPASRPKELVADPLKNVLQLPI